MLIVLNFNRLNLIDEYSWKIQKKTGRSAFFYQKRGSTIALPRFLSSRNLFNNFLIGIFEFILDDKG